ncbi:hypothetical protein MIND_00249900 [Mycena indigotica]|uniref:Uncharacterized protein n=1 Tax=Mycena indigotica TaxID=2126181 RepID=A0A8H6T7I7_9AGAR|nr:uncharacterized protein MIND_00249900 [Mycena indigotica]KAF7312366.1 hypothetical protein MIND_00249900 [Mycena indigotica]
MALPQSQAPFLAERVDVHKGCRSLETLLNVLNDYCEAAGAVVLLQKKLAKALREASGIKVNGEIAANAMNASATIFEALSDIDSKFAKIADKEYDVISGEVKKWFKKLAKEEKAHDDRISNANAKIKQAGQLYEKKSKKNPRDSAEEHARYINLISTLGPEISQEKYNHSLQVTQRHVATTYSVAACLSRIADAEWLRTCEGVRRFSPAIGPLGEWRALCEGGWTGAVPPSLVDPDVESPPTEPETRGEELPNTLRNIEPPSYEREQTTALTPLSSPRPPRNQLPPPSSFEPPRPLVDPNSGSVRSLSAFPLPPSHFPIPSRQQLSQQGSSSSSVSNSNSNVNFPSSQPESTLLEPERQAEEPLSRSPTPNRSPAETSSPHEPLEIKRPIPIRSQTADSYQPPTNGYSTPNSFPRGDYVADPSPKQITETPEWVQAKSGVQRSDTGGSNGSVVAAMRNRYSATPGVVSSPPPPKDMPIPRLPLSVSDLASRYQPDSAPTSPQRSSPVQTRSPQQQPASPDRYPGIGLGERSNSAGFGRPLPTPSSSRLPDDTQRNQQALDEVAELEFLEKEKMLQEREREISLRAQELEAERANLRNLRGEDSKPQLRPRERKTSFRTSPLPRPQSQLETRSQQPSYVGNTHSHSYSTTHLVPPQAQPTPSSRSSNSSVDGTPHAISCGCEACSVQHYKSPSNRAPSPHDLRPPEKPFTLRTEKPKGWIRRLSMPAVSNAFSLDKKSPKMYSLDAGRRGVNGSATALHIVDEEGRMGGRRSYDAGAVGNRSVTSLVGAGRR